MSHERLRITYQIEIIGPHNEHQLDTVTEWGLEGLIELFSQEGYTVTNHKPPIIDRAAPLSKGKS